jgi:HlyD family secretion protein
VKRKYTIALVAAGIVVVLGLTLLVFRGKIFPSPAASESSSSMTLVKVSRGDISSSISASGQLQPNTVTTIRPDSNMPTRKLITLLVKEGERVEAGQALAKVDPSGLDLDLKSAQASYQAQKAKLDNILAKPAGLDAAQAEADLAQARNTLEDAEITYTSTKALADKDLASKNQLADAERQLSLAKSRYDNADLSYRSVKAQSQDDVLQSQEAAVAQADSALRKARLIFDSATVRSPVNGIVAEIDVNVGDLVGPSTAMMTVIDPDPMWLLAQINENDVVQLKVGQPAAVTPSGYPDMALEGKVIQLDLRAQVQSNVSVFTAIIQVPNRDGKLLWGMNADAEISVLSMRNVLTLPTSAVKTVNGASQVTIQDEGKLVTWDVEVGANDGSKIQIVAGLEEGEEVVVQRRSTGSSTTNQNRQQQQGGPGGGFGGEIFRVIR